MLESNAGRDRQIGPLPDQEVHPTIQRVETWIQEQGFPQRRAIFTGELVTSALSAGLSLTYPGEDVHVGFSGQKRDEAHQSPHLFVGILVPNQSDTPFLDSPEGSRRVNNLIDRLSPIGTLASRRPPVHIIFYDSLEIGSTAEELANAIEEQTANQGRDNLGVMTIPARASQLQPPERRLPVDWPEGVPLPSIEEAAKATARIELGIAETLSKLYRKHGQEDDSSEDVIIEEAGLPIQTIRDIATGEGVTDEFVRDAIRSASAASLRGATAITPDDLLARARAENLDEEAIGVIQEEIDAFNAEQEHGSPSIGNQSNPAIDAMRRVYQNVAAPLKGRHASAFGYISPEVRSAADKALLKQMSGIRTPEDIERAQLRVERVKASGEAGPADFAEHEEEYSEGSNEQQGASEDNTLSQSTPPLESDADRQKREELEGILDKYLTDMAQLDFVGKVVLAVDETEGKTYAFNVFKEDINLAKANARKTDELSRLGNELEQAVGAAIPIAGRFRVTYLQPSRLADLEKRLQERGMHFQTIDLSAKPDSGTQTTE